MTEALLATGRHTVTAISRAGSKNTVPEGVIRKSVDYDDEASMVEALKGQQFLIIAMAATAGDAEAKLLKAAGKAGVSWVLPTSYCSDLANKKLCEENIHGMTVWNNIHNAEAAGLSWVAMCCSFWYEFSLSMGLEWYGFDFKNRKVNFYDDGTTRINTSTWLQCGRAIASLLSFKILPVDENDDCPTLSRWRNKPFYVSSFLASQRDMLDSANRVLGTTDADWTITSENSSERYAKGQALMKQGGAHIRLGFATCLYTRTFYPNGGGDFEDKLDNTVLGLPKEDFDEATARGIKMSQGEQSYRPAGH